MKQLQKLAKNHWLFLIILGIGTFLGLYQLDMLPAEIWGDATAHYALADQVRHGKLFFDYRYGGDGPIYTYLVVVVSWFLGLSFYTLKFTSVLIYLLFIVVMYFLAQELFNKKDFAYVTSFLAAVSFWSLTFARQPHSRMLVPLFVAAATLFALRKKTVLAGIFLGFGMYAQASFWAMPLVFWRRYKILLIGLIITIPLLIVFATSGVGFFTTQSYFGEKLAITDRLPLSLVVQNIASNISANFFSFFLRGDEGFRLNVPESPHLDMVSALFFFVGFLLLFFKALKRKKIQWLEFIILPFFLIQIPSLLDVHNPQAQPNIGRMIGIIPFVYLSIAYGLVTTCQTIMQKTIDDNGLRKVLIYFCVLYLLLLIAAANCYKYFIIYPHFLPDQNTPFARIIAQQIDEYPQTTPFFVIGSGWGEWGQPEHQAIVDALTKPHSLTFLDPTISQSALCHILNTTKPPVIITNPADKKIQGEIAHCNHSTQAYILQKNKFTVARVIEVK